MIKQALLRYPTLYRAARASYFMLEAARREAIALIHFGPRVLIGAIRAKESETYRQELPVQAVRRVMSEELSLEPVEIERWCRSNRLAMAAGADAIYLPPQTFARMPLDGLSLQYPSNAGLKIARAAGGAKERYVAGKMGRKLTHLRSAPHLEQTLTFNYLHLQGIAPRLFDLVEIEDANGVIRTAYVVEHIETEPPRIGDSQIITSRLKALEEQDRIELISSASWRGADFDPPDCRGNLRREPTTGHLYYVDIHNLQLKRYERHLTELAKSVSGTSHFGTRSRVLGGAYLYQEVPGVDLPAKRSPRRRMKAWDRLMSEAGLQLQDKVVLDVGCNLGLMGAECLRRGARWLHGWDLPDVVEAARQILLSIGCTRFSLTGARFDHDIDLAADLPLHLGDLAAEDVVLNYLAIRGHVGWLPAIRGLPWRWMLYEGHQNDDDLCSQLAGLESLVPIRIRATDSHTDGVSFRRDVAVIERLS